MSLEIKNISFSDNESEDNTSINEEHKLVNGIKIPLTINEILEKKSNEKKFEQEQKKLKKEEYKKLRKNAYPTIEDLVVALWEHVIEGKEERSKELQSARLTVKKNFSKI